MDIQQERTGTVHPDEHTSGLQAADIKPEEIQAIGSVCLEDIRRLKELGDSVEREEQRLGNVQGGMINLLILNDYGLPAPGWSWVEEQLPVVEEQMRRIRPQTAAFRDAKRQVQDSLEL